MKEFLSQEMRPQVMPVLRSFCGREVRLVGTGGTIAILAKLAAGSTDVSLASTKATNLDIDQVRRAVTQLWSLPLTERSKIKSIPPGRADLVLTGSVILEQMLLVDHIGGFAHFDCTASRQPKWYRAHDLPSNCARSDSARLRFTPRSE